MKNLFLTAAFLLFALGANAQKELSVENQYPGDESAQQRYLTVIEKQANEKTSALRTAWLPNKPGDNWFISLQAGGGGVWNADEHRNFTNPFSWFKKADRDNTYWHPTVGLSVGKWYSPVWGLRLNANYGSVQSTYNTTHNIGVYYADATVDFLLNLKNFFLPYNPNGFFNPVLYVGAGAISTLDGDRKPDYYNIAEKAGLQLNFRLNRAFDIFLDGGVIVAPTLFDKNPHATFISSDFITNATIGITYKFNFRPFIKTPLYDQAEVDALLKEINALRNRPVPVCPPVVQCPPANTNTGSTTEVTNELDPVFFTINSYAVRDNQLVSVAKAAEFLVNNPSAKIELASYADRNTGTPAYNLKLSKKRSEAVANVLVNKFGIDRKRLTLKHYGDTVQPFAENDWNRVTLFVK